METQTNDLRGTGRQVRDTMKEGLQDVQRRISTYRAGTNWKKVLSVAAIVGTVGAIALNRRRKSKTNSRRLSGDGLSQGRGGRGKRRTQA